jgi:hypothetical protein
MLSNASHCPVKTEYKRADLEYKDEDVIPPATKRRSEVTRAAQ